MLPARPARAYDWIVKVSRSIADIVGDDQIVTSHLAEATHHYSLDRQPRL